jgi:arsenate reductase
MRSAFVVKPVKDRSMLKLYTYQGCSTCRTAVKWLRAAAIPFTEIPIREAPPSLAELKAMLAARGGELRLLFNTSGQDYRALGLKDKLSKMPAADAMKLLSTNGNLVKRPFAIDEKRQIFFTGFREAEWQAAFDISASR